MPSARLIRIFEQIKTERDLPDVLRTDNGPDFLEMFSLNGARIMGFRLIILSWVNENAYVDRFNGTRRDEVLNTWLFGSMDEVQ